MTGCFSDTSLPCNALQPRRKCVCVIQSAPAHDAEDLLNLVYTSGDAVCFQARPVVSPCHQGIMQGCPRLHILAGGRSPATENPCTACGNAGFLLLHRQHRYSRHQESVHETFRLHAQVSAGIRPCRTQAHRIAQEFHVFQAFLLHSFIEQHVFT